MNKSQKTTIIVLVALFGLLAALCCCCLAISLGTYLLADSVAEAPNMPTPSPSDFIPAEGDQIALIQELEKQLLETETTNTDYWSLYGKFESETGEPISRQAIQGRAEYQVGELQTFWMSDEEEGRYWQTDAELMIRTAHAYLYVSQETSFDMEKLQEAAQLFESQIYPTNRTYFGSEWTPGIDNDPRVTILVTDEMPAGIAGYFSSVDEYPAIMQPRSNQQEMIYVTSDYLDDLELFGQLLSHEFQHMIHWNQDQSEALWINEGLSLLAEEVNNYPSVLGSWQFWSDTDIQLNNWAEDSDDRYRNYAASKLFISYLSEHYGGYGVLAELAADDAYGIQGINHLLQAGGYDADLNSVFADWVVANLLNDQSIGDGRYSYALHDGSKPEFQMTFQEGQGEIEQAGWVNQFGADYVEIDPNLGSHLLFDGSGLVQLTETEPHSGQFAWWSNRRNMLSSSLTRPVDLSQVEAASLHFWTWFDIEQDFDYGYVAVSADDGNTWTTLPGTHTTSQDPNEANYGHGYTGKSQTWLEETVDLSAYAGQRILLRFWQISDPGLNQPGWLVDEISIPEIGFYDDAEEDNAWSRDGFIRSSNKLAQSYIVQLVEYGPEITVHRLDLDTENDGRVKLGDETYRAVLVISGTTRWTSEPAPYRVTVSR